MSSNARKSIGGNIKRLINRERGDVRQKLLEAAARAETKATLPTPQDKIG